MFKKGEYVVTANNGICIIEDIMHLDNSMSSKDKLYYLLVPVEEKSAKVYIPTEGINNRFRKIMNEKEAWKVIDEIPSIEEMWIDNDKQREQRYKEAIHSCEPEKLVSIIKNMYNRKLKRTAQGKKNTAVDERYYKLAENNLYTELAFAMEKDKNDMQSLITERMQEI
jgi:CarD family transcriptional regulator